MIASGLIAVCPVVELEFLYSARSAADRLTKADLLRRTFGWVPMGDDAYSRAEQVQVALTARGQHRSAGPVDLLIAATAEHSRLTVLTDDLDFRVIAGVTNQPVRLVSHHPG